MYFFRLVDHRGGIERIAKLFRVVATRAVSGALNVYIVELGPYSQSILRDS
jgi:hypothetical protein